MAYPMNLEFHESDDSLIDCSSVKIAINLLAAYVAAVLRDAVGAFVPEIYKFKNYDK